MKKLLTFTLTVLFFMSINPSFGYDIKNKTLSDLETYKNEITLLSECKNNTFLYPNIVNNKNTTIRTKKSVNYCHVFFINDVLTHCKLSSSELSLLEKENITNINVAIEKLKNDESILSEDFDHSYHNTLIKNSEKCTVSNILQISKENDETKKSYFSDKGFFEHNLYDCKTSKTILNNPITQSQESVSIKKIDSPNQKYCIYEKSTSNHTIDCVFNLDDQGYRSKIAKMMNYNIESFELIEKSDNWVFIDDSYFLINNIYKNNCKIKRTQ